MGVPNKLAGHWTTQKNTSPQEALAFGTPVTSHPPWVRCILFPPATWSEYNFSSTCWPSCCSRPFQTCPFTSRTDVTTQKTQLDTSGLTDKDPQNQ
ncbi:hypothetical protein J4Q44_G00392590 [Coregonus suidteri]|uniref:Uncharacterized protein n=1 Tax=Coregonus suidteri TaxID=861788 RepID=A0AAN8Q3I6_9TELE